MLANLHKMHGFYKTDGANKISKINCWKVAGKFRGVAGEFQGVQGKSLKIIGNCQGSPEKYQKGRQENTMEFRGRVWRVIGKKKCKRLGTENYAPRPLEKDLGV